MVPDALPSPATVMSIVLLDCGVERRCQVMVALVSVAGHEPALAIAARLIVLPFTVGGARVATSIASPRPCGAKAEAMRHLFGVPLARLPSLSSATSRSL